MSDTTSTVKVSEAVTEQPVISAVEPVEPAVLPEVSEAAVAIEALLNDPVPDDVRDPEAVARRTRALVGAAVAAGESMVEFLARIGEEKRSGVHMTEGHCVLNTSDAMIGLHKALITYRHDVQSWDGLDVARAAIEREHGVGVADLVLVAFTRLRVELDALVQETLLE
jgi:hypothetical protein